MSCPWTHSLLHTIPTTFTSTSESLFTLKRSNGITHLHPQAAGALLRRRLDRHPVCFPRNPTLDSLLIRCYSGIAAVGAGFWKKKPNHRPFSPVDPDISFPYVEHEKISTGLLVTIALVIPALITAFVALVFTPGPGVSQGAPKSRIWRIKLWEWNTAWMGLALALATTFFFTEGLKNIIGKPRPDLLSRCNLDPATVQQYALGGEGSQLPLWNLLISSTACRQPSASKLNDGFASFPSGHSSCKSDH